MHGEGACAAKEGCGGVRGKGGVCGRGRGGMRGRGIHAGETVTEAGGMHPTGMHSCSLELLQHFDSFFLSALYLFPFLTQYNCLYHLHFNNKELLLLLIILQIIKC